MRLCLVGILIVAFPVGLASQAPGKWPPDSLVNVQVIPRTTPVMEVVGAMRNIAFGLGVRCQFCHVGEEGMPLERFDFASDEKRTKLVARQMMRMVQEINRRLDTHGQLLRISNTAQTAGGVREAIHAPSDWSAFDSVGITLVTIGHSVVR